MNANPLPGPWDDFLAMDYDYLEHQDLQDQASGLEFSSFYSSSAAPLETENSLYSIQMDEFRTKFPHTTYPPARPDTLLSSPAVPALAYACSVPWPTQGGVDMPSSCGPSFYTDMAGLSPIVGADTNVQRIVVFTDLPDVWDRPEMAISATQSVISSQKMFKEPRKPRNPRTIQEFKARKKPLTRIRNTRGFKGVGTSRNKTANEFSPKCYHCVFTTRKPCKYIDGQDWCESCMLAIRKWASSNETIFRNPQGQVLDITLAYWVDLKLTYATLFEFENDIINSLGPRTKEPLLDNPQKFRLCSMSCDATSTPFSNRLQPVLISYDTISEAAKGNGPPRPPLNAKHMNRFIDRHIMDLLGAELYDLMTPVITVAMRFGVWLAILFNFDDNTVFRSHDLEDSEVRSLILWTMYSITFEIDQNLVFLSHEANTSLTSGDDRESVACALAVAYELAQSHQVLTKNPMIPKSLHKFLAAFHERSECALKTIQRARNEYGTFNCERGGIYVQLRKILIDIQRELDPMMHLTYESSEPIGIPGVERTDHSFMCRQSQSQILETRSPQLSNFNHISQQHSNPDRSGVSNSTIDHLTEANLRCYAKGKLSTDEMDDCSSTHAVTYNDPTTVAEVTVSDSATEPWCPSELGAMDLQGLEFGQWLPKFQDYQLDGGVENDYYAKQFFEGDLMMELDSELEYLGGFAEI